MLVVGAGVGVSPSRCGRGGTALAIAVASEAAATTATAAVTATTAAIAATEAATTAATEATPVATAEATAIAAPEAAAVTVAAVIAVALAHLDGRLGLVCVYAHRQEANDVGGEAHAPLHLGHRRRRCVDIHERVVGLAIFLDLEGETLEAPVFDLADPAATFLDDLAVLFGQRFGLRLADVLARQEHVLV